MVNFKKKLMRHFLKEGENSKNAHMKKKQNIIGALFLVLLSFLVFGIYFLSIKKEKDHSHTNPYKKTDIDGVMSTDFYEKNSKSALEKEQNQLDLMKKKIEMLEKQKKEQKKGISENEVVDQINKILFRKETEKKREMPK